MLASSRLCGIRKPPSIFQTIRLTIAKNNNNNEFVQRHKKHNRHQSNPFRHEQPNDTFLKGKNIRNFATDRALSTIRVPTELIKHDSGKEITGRIPYPREIVTYLDKYIVGQNFAKMSLAVGVYQHYKKLLHNLELKEENDAIIESKKQQRTNIRRRHQEINPIVGVNKLAHQKYMEELERQLDREIKNKHNARTLAKELGKKFEKEMNESPKEAHFNLELLEKSNIVLVGPSGVGKTALTQKLASILDVPFAMCDCTVLTQAGYVGDDADTVIQKLLQNSDGDIDRAQRGIVFLDEFDKIATTVDHVHSSSGFRDVSGRGVQQALLKIVEGSVVKVKSPLVQGAKVEVDTSGILFIASGAFNNLDRVIANRMQQKSVGFGSGFVNHQEDLNANDEAVVAKKRDELLLKAEQADLISFGMVPELVGRFPVVVPFHSLDEDALVRVMREPRNSIISQSERQFTLDGIKLEFTEEALYAIAKEAVKRKTGARALRSIFERILLTAKYECPGSDTVGVVIDKETVEGKSPYVGLPKKEAHTSTD